MTYTEEYREHIEYTFHAYCKIVIRHAAIDAARQRHRRCEKEISLEYLTEEKHYPLSTFDEYFTEPEGQYSLHLCGREVLLSHPQLATALLRLPERKQEMLYLRFFHNYIYKEIGRRYWRMKSVERLPYDTIVQACSGEPQAVETILFHYDRYIKYVSLVGGRVHADTEEYVKAKLIESLFKFCF